jgi:transposase InsO family protein
MRFRLVDAAMKDFPFARLCKVLEVSPSGYFAWKNRPASTRQREDLVLLAHVRSAFTLSHETYGSPRMTHELREKGLAAGRRRVAHEYQAERRRNGIVISMSGQGNCYDNAMVETFFKTLKSELVWRTAFQIRSEAIDALARYIDGFYNPRRRHSALGSTSPILFERGIAHQNALH